MIENRNDLYITCMYLQEYKKGFAFLTKNISIPESWQIRHLKKKITIFFSKIFPIFLEFFFETLCFDFLTKIFDL